MNNLTTTAAEIAKQFCTYTPQAQCTEEYLAELIQRAVEVAQEREKAVRQALSEFSKEHRDYVHKTDAELSSLREDKARLDWLIRRIRVKDQTLVFDPIPYNDNTLDSRPAIDAAMQANT